MTNISYGAFFGCDSLTSVEIPSSMTSIGAWAFSSKGLTRIKCFSSTPPECSDSISIFYSVNKGDCILYVPSESITAYKNADGWKDFDNIKAIPTGDCNSDGGITMADANAVVNYFLTTDKPEDFNEDAADVNCDGQVTMADANMIVNMFLGGT